MKTKMIKADVLISMLFRVLLACIFVAGAELKILGQTNGVPTPQWVATWSGAKGEDIYGVFVVNQKAYLAANTAGLIILDLSQPSTPVELGRYDTVGLAQCVEVVGSLAYVADGTNGLQIIDVSDPVHPSLVGGTPSTGFTRRLHVEGQFAYLADMRGGMQIVDVGNPAQPVRAALLPNLIDYTTSVYVDNNLAFVIEPSAYGAVDVSNPYAPRRLANNIGANYCEDVFVVGNRAYITQYVMADLINPQRAGFLMVDSAFGRLNVPGAYYYASKDNWSQASAVYVKDKYAYVLITNAGRGLKIIDVSTLGNTSLVGSYDTEYDGIDVHVEGDYAYVADGQGGLVILSLFSPPPVPTPLKLSVARDQQTLLLVVSGLEMNKPYRIEASTNLTQWATWDRLNGSVTEQTIRIITTNPASRFYRVVKE